MRCPTCGRETRGKPKSTGPNSQNSHFHGHVQQICSETGNSFDTVKMHLKTLALDRGYGFEVLPDGAVWPKSVADATSWEAAILIETAHQFAAEWNIRLIEE